MRFAKTCGHCSRSFTLTEADFVPLSRTEQLLCQKEGLDWTRMVKVTCTECGTSSLVQEAELRAVTASEAVDETLASLAARVRAVGAGVTHEVLSKWIENLARNLDEASVAAKSGRDRNGAPMSRAQLSESLERMRGEYAKGIDRLGQVAGADARATIERILGEIATWSGTAQPRDRALQPVPDTVPYDIHRRYTWPRRCVCCLADQVETDVPVLSSSSKLEIGGGEVLRAPYCKVCANHTDTGPVSWLFIGCGGVLLAIFLVFVAESIAKQSLERVKPPVILAMAIVGGLLFFGGIYLRRKLKLAAAGQGCVSKGEAVTWKGLYENHRIVFRNLEYARLFIEANDLHDVITAAKPGGHSELIARLFPQRAALIHGVAEAKGKKSALLAIANRHGIADENALALSKHLQTEEKLFTRIQKDAAILLSAERSSNQLLFVAEAASLAVVGGVGDVIAVSRDLESARMHLLRQKTIADNGVNLSMTSTTVLLIAGGIYDQAEKLLKNRSEMFALLDRN